MRLGGQRRYEARPSPADCLARLEHPVLPPGWPDAGRLGRPPPEKLVVEPAADGVLLSYGPGWGLGLHGPRARAAELRLLPLHGGTLLEVRTIPSSEVRRAS